MIIRSGVSARNRTDRNRPDRPIFRPIEHPCQHGFYTPTQIIILFGREVEISGPGRCPTHPS